MKEKNPVGSKPNEWRVEQEIDLLNEAAKMPLESFQMKDWVKSVLVTMNNELSEPSILKSLIENKLERFENQQISAVDKRNTVVDCSGEEVAVEVAALLKVEVTGARVSRNYCYILCFLLSTITKCSRYKRYEIPQCKITESAVFHTE